MQFRFTDEQRMLRDSVRDVLSAQCAPIVVRAAWNGDHAPSAHVWTTLADLGLIGACAPIDCGGLGQQLIDVLLPLEECGSAALVGPLVDTMAVVVPMLRGLVEAKAATSAFCSSRLEAIVAGDLRVAVSWDDAVPVAYHSTVGAVLVIRRDECRWVDASAIRWLVEKSVDRTRDLARLEPGDARGELLVDGASASAFVERADHHGAVATAAVLCGLSRRMLEMSVEYAKTRQQFGVPIGSQQAVKHRLANALIEQEFARPLVHRAAWELGAPREHPSGRADSDLDIEVIVSMAKLRAAQSASFVAKQCLQVHGAIGYTTECDLHMWMKRVWALQNEYGTPRDHLAVLRAKLRRATDESATTSPRSDDARSLPC